MAKKEVTLEERVTELERDLVELVELLGAKIGYDFANRALEIVTKRQS